MSTDPKNMTTTDAAQVLGGAVMLIMMEGEGFQAMRLIVSQAIIEQFFGGSIAMLDQKRVHELGEIYGVETISEACAILVNRFDFGAVLEDTNAE